MRFCIGIGALDDLLKACGGKRNPGPDYQIVVRFVDFKLDTLQKFALIV